MRQRPDFDDQVADEALLAGIAVHDEQAVLIFVRRYQRRLFGLALAIVGDPGLAEDVAQEAFIRILRHASVFDPRRGSVTTWTLTITRNLAIDALRIRRAVPVAPTDRVFAGLVSSDDSPDDVATLSDTSEPLAMALRQLPVDQRRAVLLACVYGRTALEIAAEESIPLGTAKSRIRLGMAKLREAAVAKGLR
jgi:RNA polymerase sigma-70 factor (ECF subfamily)